MAAWPLILYGFLCLILDPIIKWLMTLLIYLSLSVIPLPDFKHTPCGWITHKVIAYLIYKMYPSYIVIPLFLYIHISGFWKLSISEIPELHRKHVTYPGLCFTVDGHTQLPMAYMIVSAIMLAYAFM
jgi:hypothetical protein